MEAALPDPQQGLSEVNRLRFAAMFKRWRKRAGWSNETLHRWGDEAGFATPRNSTCSKLERGLIDSPDLVTFLQLAECNRRVAVADYGAVQSRYLLEQLKAQRPITRSDGALWGFAEFSGYFCGGGVEDPVIEPLVAARRARRSDTHRERRKGKLDRMEERIEKLAEMVEALASLSQRQMNS